MYRRYLPQNPQSGTPSAEHGMVQSSNMNSTVGNPSDNNARQSVNAPPHITSRQKDFSHQSPNSSGGNSAPHPSNNMRSRGSMNAGGGSPAAQRSPNRSTAQMPNNRAQKRADCNAAQNSNIRTQNTSSNGNSQTSQDERAANSGILSILSSVVPSSIYNPATKRVLGFLTAEDLLIIALVFLFAENSEKCDPLLIPALIYILISDYIDFPDILP